MLFPYVLLEKSMVSTLHPREVEMTSTVRLPSPVGVAIKWTVVYVPKSLEGPMRWEWDLEDRQ